jgi:hypothetical protein
MQGGDGSASGAAAITTTSTMKRSASGHVVDHLWHGPTWLSRLAGHMPHVEPQGARMKRVRLVCCNASVNRKALRGQSGAPTVRQAAKGAAFQPSPHPAPPGVPNKHQQHQKVLGLLGLTLMSTAVIVGSGIFVLTGVVAKNYAGPAVVVSYAIGGAVALLSALSYAEFAAETRTTGASIVYVSKVFGKFVGWLVAINVLMELIIAAAAVATGFSGYFAALVKTLDGITHAPRLTNWPGTFTIVRPGAGGADVKIDLVAMGAVLLVTALLAAGVGRAAAVQRASTGLCLFSIVICIIVGFVYADPSNWSPFAPFGFGGVFRGASVVFFACVWIGGGGGGGGCKLLVFAHLKHLHCTRTTNTPAQTHHRHTTAECRGSYLGFEMMCACPEDAYNATRDVPRALTISVTGCALLYLLMSLAVTGLQPYTFINAAAPFSEAFKARGAVWMCVFRFLFWDGGLSRCPCCNHRQATLGLGPPAPLERSTSITNPALPSQNRLSPQGRS